MLHSYSTYMGNVTIERVKTSAVGVMTAAIISISTILIPASVTSIGSQSSWSPSTISGYSGTQAQVYATGNGISFQSLGGETQQEQQNPGTSGTSENQGNTSQAGSGSATTVTGGGTAVTGGNVIGATKNSNSGKTVTSGSHVNQEQQFR